MEHENLNSQDNLKNPEWDSVTEVPFRKNQEAKTRHFSLPKIEINRDYEADDYPKHRRKIIRLLDWKARQTNNAGIMHQDANTGRTENVTEYGDYGLQTVLEKLFKKTSDSEL